MKSPITLGLAGLIAALGVTTTIQSTAMAVDAKTVPVGFVTLEIDAGTGASYQVSTVSLPLRSAPDDSTGELVGKLTAVGATTLSNSAAGWAPGAFSNAATPYFVRIKSGAAEGRILQISTSTPNTADELTVLNQGTDLSTLGIAVGTEGDTYEIFPADTLSSIFGDPGTTGILGGTTSGAADQVQVFDPASGWGSFFYNTNSGAWVKTGIPINSDNLVLRPDQGIIYLRLADSDLSIVLLGTVPETNSQSIVSNGGVSFLGSTWPTDTTLATSGISDMPGWVKGTVAVADQVQLFSTSGGWSTFYHNGANWVKTGIPINSDAEPIAAGAAVLINKQGSAAGVSTLSQTIPYDLTQ